MFSPSSSSDGPPPRPSSSSYVTIRISGLLSSLLPSEYRPGLASSPEEGEATFSSFDPNSESFESSNVVLSSVGETDLLVKGGDDGAPAPRSELWTGLSASSSRDAPSTSLSEVSSVRTSLVILPGKGDTANSSLSSAALRRADTPLPRPTPTDSSSLERKEIS